jgi:hypothetical protein
MGCTWGSSSNAVLIPKHEFIPQDGYRKPSANADAVARVMAYQRDVKRAAPRAAPQAVLNRNKPVAHGKLSELRFAKVDQAQKIVVKEIVEEKTTHPTEWYLHEGY